VHQQFFAPPLTFWAANGSFRCRTTPRELLHPPPGVQLLLLLEHVIGKLLDCRALLLESFRPLHRGGSFIPGLSPFAVSRSRNRPVRSASSVASRSDNPEGQTPPPTSTIPIASRSALVFFRASCVSVPDVNQSSLLGLFSLLPGFPLHNFGK